MKRGRLSERLRYRYENFMSKGGGALFWSLLILFLIAFLISIFVRKVFLWVNPDSEIFANFWEHIWLTFLQIIDPGAIMEDTGSSFLLKLSAIVTTFLGIVIFSMLIAFITTRFEEVIYNFRKGRSRVFEKKHTLILGWNERVLDIVGELILANESEKYASIVILADRDKEEMDEEVQKGITNTKTTRIVTREGNTASLTELGRVNAGEARSVIILASCSEMADEEDKAYSDTRAVKTILALLAMQGGENKLNLVAEIFKEENRKLLDSIGSDRIIAINKWEILGKALVQTSLTSGLEMVFAEIFSFDGAEIYFYESEWNGVTFGESFYHLPDGVPLGIYKTNGELAVRPSWDTVLEAGDELIILAEDDSSLDYKKAKLFTPKDFAYTPKRIKRTSKRELILGWHGIGEIVVNEYADYLENGSIIDIMVDNPSEELKGLVMRMDTRYNNLAVNLVPGNPMNSQDLHAVNPFSYDNVIILSQDEKDFSPEKTDSDTLVILLLLRKIMSTSAIEKRKTKIITQVLNSENEELIHQSNVDDFLISNKLLSMLFAQMSEEPRLRKLYNDLFGEEGSEIYLKPAELYFDELPLDLTFTDVIRGVSKRDEICMGIQFNEMAQDPKKNFGIVLNLAKGAKIHVDKGERLVVLAEDET